jgi:integrase
MQDDADFDPTPEMLAWGAKVQEHAAREWEIERGSALLDMPLHAFYAVLLARYSNSLQVFLQKAPAAGENVRLSQAFAEVFRKRGWRVGTARKYAAGVKRILALLPLPAGFVETLRWVGTKKACGSRALGKFARLPPGHPARQRVEGWVEILREETRCNSDLSLNNVLRFFCNTCVPSLGLDLAAWPEDVSARVSAHLEANPDSLSAIVGAGKDATLKRGRLELFLHKVLRVAGVTLPKVRKRKAAAAEDDGDDDGRDVHRLSPEELERLHAEARKRPRDELFFMLMLTTGLRVGGVSKTLLKNVADVKQGAYVVKGHGKTKEKGSKFATFVICPQVRELILAWLTGGRPADEGPYLFPGATRGSHISTETIRASFAGLCKRCGIEGPQCHPHALRHTHAHLLLACGNSVESVSKCLNHASIATTRQFYLRESAAEAQARCNIPWAQPLSESEKRAQALAALPSFLAPPAAAPAPAASDEAKRRRRAHRDMLEQFTRDVARA